MSLLNNNFLNSGSTNNYSIVLSGIFKSELINKNVLGNKLLELLSVQLQDAQIPNSTSKSATGADLVKFNAYDIKDPIVLTFNMDTNKKVHEILELLAGKDIIVLNMQIFKLLNGEVKESYYFSECKITSVKKITKAKTKTQPAINQEQVTVVPKKSSKAVFS